MTAQVNITVKKALQSRCKSGLWLFMESELAKIYPYPVAVLPTGLDLGQPDISVDLVDFGGIQPKEVERVMELVYAVLKSRLGLDTETVFVNLKETTLTMKF